MQSQPLRLSGMHWHRVQLLKMKSRLHMSSTLRNSIARRVLKLTLT